MLRKRFIALIYLFSVVLLFVAGGSYLLLKGYTTRFHYYESVQRLMSLYNFEIHNHLLTGDRNQLQQLTQRILSSDSALQMVIIDNGKEEFQSISESRQDIKPEVLYAISLDDIAPEDMQSHIIKGLGVKKHASAIFSKSFFLHEKVIGRLFFSLRSSDQLNLYMKHLFIGASFIFLLVCGLCLVLIIMVNKSLHGHNQLVEQISSVDYCDIGLTTDIDKSDDEVQNIAHIFSALVEEVKKSYCELKEQNQRLEVNKQIFTTFLDSIDEAIVIRDKFRNIVYFNSHFIKLIGIKADLTGKKLDSYLPPKIDGIDFNLDMEIIDDLSSLSKVVEFEDRFFDVKKFCIPLDSNSYLIATIVKELTGQIRATKEKAALQRQMFLSSKLASLGVLASGVAHEMYNPMTVLLGHLDLIAKEEEISLTGKKRLEKIYSSLQKMRDFVDRLRTMDRPGNKSEFKLLQLNTLVLNIQHLLGASLNTYGIELKLDLAYSLPAFLGDSSLIENALINLFINARDAFDRVHDGREMQIVVKTLLSPAGNICLEFSDNACGIPLQYQDRLFDPLFTTSELKNNGLGLTLVREIIHQHDGDLFFFSAENEGTTFKIFLPKHQEGASESELRYRPRSSHSKDLTLLLMPQNSDFGEVLRDFLLRHYNVVICSNTAELNESLLKSCDLALGEWPVSEEEGLALVDTVKRIAPQLPLVVMGRTTGDDRLHKEIFTRGAQEVVFRDFSKLDILHDIIRKHIES